VRLGRQLRRIRLAAGYPTQAALAKRVGFGEDTISEAETGAQPPSEEVFPLLLDACTTSIDGTRQVLTPGEREAITDLWEVVRSRDTAAPQWFEAWLKVERQATLIRAWSPLLIPGLLQVEEYAMPLFLAMGKSREKATDLLTVRLGRREILAGPDPVTLVVLLEESVLYQLVDTPRTMVKQMTRLLEVSEAPNLTIQVVRGAASLAGLFGAFDLGTGPSIPDTMRTEAVQDQTTDNGTLVREASMIFELIRGRALNAEESRAVIMKAREQWESQQ
jgi:transcriptional regulator with XRE-family HTH domain